MVRGVHAAAGPVHEERLVRLERLMTVQPADGVVGEVLTQVIALLRRLRRKHAGRVAHEVRLILRRLTGQEPVEVLKTQTGRPVVERPRRCGLQRRRVVPLPPRRRRVPVLPQHLGHQRTAPGDLTGVAVPVVGQLSDLTVPDPVMVTASQQRGPSRGAHRRGVEPVVPDALAVDPRQRVGPDLPAKGGRQPGSHIIDQHDQNVRRILRQPTRLHSPLVHRLLHRAARDARRPSPRERQHLLRPHGDSYARDSRWGSAHTDPLWRADASPRAGDGVRKSRWQPHQVRIRPGESCRRSPAGSETRRGVGRRRWMRGMLTSSQLKHGRPDR